jgi:hypothetical protein
VNVFEEGEFVALKQKGLNRKLGSRKKPGSKEGDSSIHDLKLQKLKAL